MNSYELINSYLDYLYHHQYPSQIIERRELTFNRFLKTYGELNHANIIDFMAANDFLRRRTYNLLKIDLICLLSFLRHHMLIDDSLFRQIDKEIDGF
ncbi:MAG: hypothetical protein KDD94_02720 [Calditrichaeota bacterium]|nr:hypothetical protein [Calditrichota bacterium]